MKEELLRPKDSKTCPLCSGSMASYEGRSMKRENCGLVMDRDVIAVLNLQMWGIGFSPKALDELIKREELGRDEINKPLHTPT